MASKVDNIYLVNAPAGSGKTTKIKSMIVKHKINSPIDNILCITYTNRAAEELKLGINENGVDIKTIHSFLHDFIKLYFHKEEIIDLYVKLYKNQIHESIDNELNKEHIANRNQRFIEKYGELNIESIRKNILRLYYNESSNDHLYKGGLSHDGLIYFAEKMFEDFPVIKLRLTQKYQMIFIDEYQDSSASVLKMFYSAGINTNTKIYFLGDKMQQIYKNYDGTFEKQLKTLNTEITLDTNHRSVKPIVDVLNNIYNDSTFKQKTSKRNLVIKAKHTPRVLICNNIQERLEKEHANQSDALLLYLLNSKRFKSIGASNLYKSFNSLDRYSFSKKVRAVDVLNGDTVENVDPLLKLLFVFHSVFINYEKRNLGSIIQIFKRYNRLFRRESFIITHSDRVRLSREIANLFEVFNRDISIGEFLDELQSFTFFNVRYLEDINDEYKDVLNVRLSEFKALSTYLNKPKVSTQHGVKGESHNSVFFISEDSNYTPIVHMHKFFELWTKTELSLNSFESFYYEYMEQIIEVWDYIGCKSSDISVNDYKRHKQYLDMKVKELCENYRDHQLFKELCVAPYNKHLQQGTTTTFRRCFKDTIYGTLSAYRIFYVGCSRARKNLTIFIGKENVKGYVTEIREKFENIGFTVEVEED